MTIEMSQAPWSDEQVRSLRRRQAAPFHEYACGTDSAHGPLVPTNVGWVCASCDYRQTNAIAADTTLTQAEFERLWRALGQEPPVL